LNILLYDKYIIVLLNCKQTRGN